MDTYNTSRVLPACFAFYFFLLPTSAPSPLEYEFLFYHFRAWYFTERFYGVFYDKHDGKSFSKKKMNRRKWKAMEMNFEGYVKNNTHTIPKEVLFLLQR